MQDAVVRVCGHICTWSKEKVLEPNVVCCRCATPEFKSRHGYECVCSKKPLDRQGESMSRSHVTHTREAHA